MEVAEKNMFFNCNNNSPTYNENGKSSSKRISTATTTKKKKTSDFNQNVNNTNLATNATMQHPTTTIASDYKQFKLIFYMCLLLIYRFLLRWSICQDNILKLLVSTTSSSSKRNSQCIKFLLFLTLTTTKTLAYPNNNQNQNDLIKFDKLNLEQSIAAVFNKVAYGSTTKRSIPDTAYPLTTLATPLLTTFRYSDGQDEWLRVDLKNNGAPPLDLDESGGGVGGGEQDEYDEEQQRGKPNGNYGFDLEKDHVLPTSAPAADILKNNNNKHYTNPNRYNNDRLRPDYNAPVEQVTENVYKTTTSSNNAKNVRPTKSIYSKDIPSYVPPSRAFFFTPPLPPQYQNPFADKPTLRGTNSDGFASRRPLPPPSLMPNKDRIPFRPDLPSTKVNMEKIPAMYDETTVNNRGRSQQQGGITPAAAAVVPSSDNKKKSLNTPSQNAKFGGNGGEFYGLNRNHLMNETNQFEYEKSYAPEPSITRILSGSNGRHDDIQIPDILYRTVTATPNFPAVGGADGKRARTSVVAFPQPSVPKTEEEETDADDLDVEDEQERKLLDGDKIEKQEPMHAPPLESSIIVVANKSSENQMKNRETADVTTQISDMMNLPNVKKRENANNVTKANSDEIWLICWNVHIYLVVFGYILLAIYSIFKLIRYEYDPHMFSKSYFLTIHLMLTVICVLRIFYLIYDPYNFGNSFNIFLYEFLHSFPLSLLATTFAVLILFLLKRTLTHLEVNRPVFLVFFGLLHILICLTLSTMESFGHFDKASLTICRPSFVLLVLALGISYLYLYRIIKNVLAKRSQNLSEMCTQNISYASHITIAIALLFVLLGLVQLYALFFIKIDRFNGEIKHHWILWGFELSIRFIELTIITLLAIVVSLKMAQREKQCGGGGGTTGGGGNGFPLFPTCTTSDSSTDNIYPNNCNSNPNVMNYSRNNEMLMDNLQSNGGQQAMETDTGTAPRIMLKANSNLNDFDKKSTLERCYPSGGGVQTENWLDGASTLNLNNSHFERSSQRNSKQQLNNIGAGNSTTYDSAKYYTKPKYDFDDLVSNTSSSTSTTGAGGGKMRIVGNVGEENEKNIYSEPIDNHYNQQQQQHHQHQYERTRHEFERNDLDRRSRNSTNTSGRRTGTSGGAGGRRKNHGRPHLGIQTLPPNEKQQQQHQIDSMLVDEQGFLRFRHMQDENNKRALAGDDAMLMMMMGESGREKSVKKNKRQYQQQQQNYNVESCGGGGHFSDA